MTQEFIVGRNGNQPFKITADGVSGEHARITLDNGTWFIEDLGSSNGTYLKNADGEFVKIYKKQISEDSVIRLAKGGHHSCTFTVHRLVAPENDYSYEFMQLMKMKRRFEEEEQKLEKKTTLNGWISKCAGVGVLLLCTIIGSIPGVDLDPNIRYMAIAMAPVLVGLAFKNDAIRIKSHRVRRRNNLVCPHCGRPLSDYDLENLQCSICKAK